MKRIIRILTVITLVTFATSMNSAFSQPSPGNDQTGGGNVGGAPIGGGTAPIGSGLVMLLSLAAGYGLKKAYQIKSTQIK